MKIIRPEIKGRAALALEYLAQEESNTIHKVTPTELVNTWLLKAWQEKHAGMMYPDESGVIIQIECTPALVKQ